MKNSITPNQIKQNNRNLIYHYIYQHRKVSQQDICYNLRLSRPTVTTNLSALEQDGLIEKNGQISTDYVGRKAAAYSIVPNRRVSIGVEILVNEVKIIFVNLYGQKIDRLVFAIDFAKEAFYFKTVSDKILEFKNKLNINDDQILGIGFAMQGLVSPDRQTIIYGKILSCTGLSIGEFTRYLPYTCYFLHDAECAAISEMWVSPELKNAFYLSISNHLGAAVISNGEILSGMHGHNATIEHIQMDPNGDLCYCGKKGCMETLCSLNVLLSKEESLEDFFAHLRQQEEAYQMRWEQFLTQLAKAINMLHLIHDTDYILGGYLAPYLRAEDLSFLHQEIAHMTSFSETPDFLLISKMPKHNITIGAALPFIQTFLDTGTLALDI